MSAIAFLFSLLQLQVEVGDEPATDTVVARADAVLTQAITDNIAASKRVEAVFEAAHLMVQEGRYAQAEDYFEAGLRLAPWDLDEQMAFARLLVAVGEAEEAKRVATIVYFTTERAELLEESAAIADLPLPAALEPLPPEKQEEKVICFVPLGQVDEWIMRRAARQLSATLGVRTYIYPTRIDVPGEPIAKIKNFIVWDNAFVRAQMEDLGVESRESASVDQTLEILARIAEAEGDPNPRERIAKAWQEKMQVQLAQWDTSRLLWLLERKIPKREDVVFLGITSVDLFSGGSNYSFGSAGVGSGYAVFSYRRFLASFNRERESQERLIERIHKVVVSVVGTALGLPRPIDPRSVRSYPDSLRAHDLKGTWLAPEDIEGFEEALGHPLPDATKERTRRALDPSVQIAF